MTQRRMMMPHTQKQISWAHRTATIGGTQPRMFNTGIAADTDTAVSLKAWLPAVQRTALAARDTLSTGCMVHMHAALAVLP